MVCSFSFLRQIFIHLDSLYALIKTDTFVSKKYFFENLEKIYKQLKKTKKNKNDKILLPNDKEVIISKQRKKEGIPIDKELMKEFLIISKNLDITF